MTYKKLNELFTQDQIRIAVGVTQPCISQRVKSNATITLDDAVALELNLKFSKKITRPDVFGQLEQS